MTRSDWHIEGTPRWSRRQLLRLVVASGAALPVAALLGCSRKGDAAPAGAFSGGASVGEAAAGTPTGAATSTPAPTPTEPPAPEALNIKLLPGRAAIGEAMRVQVPIPPSLGEVQGELSFNGARYAMFRLPNGALWGMVGVGLDQPTVPELPLGITITSATGAVIASGEVATAIEAIARPVEHLQATQEQTAVLAGDAGPRELAMRQGQFASFDTAAPRWRGLFTRPTDGPVTTAFGQARSINGGPIGPGHSGTDFANDEGTPVQLAAAGRVKWAGAMPIRGNSVVVDHGGGITTGYHHLSAIKVDVGDAVLPAGTIVGAVGSTGFATGPHLHWEVTVRGVNVDAMTWLVVPFSV